MTAKPYQETWLRGASVSSDFQRPCAERYEPIRAFCAQFKRPFSVLDLGANFGYFSLRIAEDFPHAICIAVDKKPGLTDLCLRNDAANVIHLNRHLTGRDLDTLARCEHFDVVLALNVLHHIADWPDAVDAVMALGDHVIVETPGRGDTGAKNPHCHEALFNRLTSRPNQLLATFGSHVSDATRPLLYFHRPGGAELRLQTVDAVKRGAPGCLVRVSEGYFDLPQTVTIDHAHGTETRPWIPGMNLWNWRLLDGAWPAHVGKLLLATVRAMPRFHDDLRPWNFILQGKKLIPIDYDNKPRRTREVPGSLELCLRMLQTGKI